MKYVRDTAAGKSISATVIMRGTRHVATIQAHYANSGGVRVDVWQTDQRALERCAAAHARAFGPGALADDFKHQQGHASGYGYDKYAAALRGILIDGIRMADHCGREGKTDRLLKRYHNDIAACSGGPACQEIAKAYEAKAAKMGAQFANWEQLTPDGEALTRAAIGERRPLSGSSGERIGAASVYGLVLRSDLDRAEGSGAAYPPEYKGRVICRWADLFIRPGTDRLRAMGYRVITAI